MSCGFKPQFHHEFTVDLGQITGHPVEILTAAVLIMFHCHLLVSIPYFLLFQMRGLCLPFKGKLWYVTLNPPLSVFFCFSSAGRLSIPPPPPYNHAFPTALPDPLAAVSSLKEWSLPLVPHPAAGPALALVLPPQRLTLLTSSPPCPSLFIF